MSGQQPIVRPLDGTVAGLRDALGLYPVDCRIELTTGAEQVGDLSYIYWNERTNMVVLG